MKLAVTIASSEAKESAFVVWRGFEQSIKKAGQLGYDGVELALKNADEIDRYNLRKWLRETNLEVSSISTGQVFADLGLYFTNKEPEIRTKTIETFSSLIELASDFCGIINIGRTRGFIAKNQSYDEAEKLFIDTLGKVCQTAEKQGVTIVVEPVNRYEINFINNLDECTELLAKTGIENCGIMPDVFHMNIEDDYIGKSLIRNGEWVKYVHLADSNRHAPGSGHIDFDEVFNALSEIKYNGWVSVEILPKPEPDVAAKNAIAFLKPKIDKYNKNL